MITGLYAGILAFIFLALTANVIKYRFKFKVGLGDGNNEEMSRIIRVQGNFIEYVPLALILIFFCELNIASAMYIHLMGITLVIARVLHAFGLTKASGNSKSRFLGTILTLLLIAFLAGSLIYQYVIA